MTPHHLVMSQVASNRTVYVVTGVDIDGVQPRLELWIGTCRRRGWLAWVQRWCVWIMDGLLALQVVWAPSLHGDIALRRLAMDSRGSLMPSSRRARFGLSGRRAANRPEWLMSWGSIRAP